MALERLFETAGETRPAEELYAALDFPDPPADQPYVFINMVATADGKTLIAPRGSTAKGIGGPTDQLLMRRLEQRADGIIIGGQTLRTSHVIYPPEKPRFVVTRSGDLPTGNRFFTDAPGRAYVLAPHALPEAARERLEAVAVVRTFGAPELDVVEAVRWIRQELGVRSLLLEGGASLNFDFFAAGLVDELFLSLAPKVKGGSELPTVVDGPGLPDRQVAPLELLSVYRDGDELYLRYRVRPATSGANKPPT